MFLVKKYLVQIILDKGGRNLPIGKKKTKTTKLSEVKDGFFY